MRRLSVLGLAGAWVALGCVDLPIDPSGETSPDPSGPSSTEGDGDGDSGDGDGDSGDGDGDSGPGDGDGDSGDGDSGDGDSGDGDGDPGSFDFSAPITTEVFAFDDLQVGDLDADGCADLVLAGTGFPPRVNIYPSTCDGSFATPPITNELTTFDGFALGDLDGDQRADLLMRGTGFPPRIEARLSTPDFDVGALVSSEVYTYDLLWSVDLDADGRAEALTHALGGSPPTIHAWSGIGDGSLTALASTQVATMTAAAIGFVNDDALGDVVTGLDGIGLAHPWLGQGDGTFALDMLFNGFLFTQLVLGDLDADGRAELLTDVPGNDWRVTIYPNVGGGFVKPAVDLEAFSYTRLRSGDLDGDGDDDIVLAPTGFPPRVTVYLSL